MLQTIENKITEALIVDPTMRLLNRILFIVLSTAFFSCSNDEVVSSMPQKFLGTWTETSDDITLGYTSQRKLNISNEDVYSYADNEEGENYLIKTIIKDSDNSVKIECVNDMDIKQILYLRIKDGFLYAKEWMPTGVSDARGDYGEQFDMGKYYKKLR
jgi:hypothetical protein